MYNSSWGSLTDVDAAEESFNQSTWPESSGSDSPLRKIPRTLSPNLTRRSHKKSRGGCLSCKSRKIKCQETKPSCENCLIKELECRYPSQANQKITHRPTCTSRADTAVVKHDEPKLPATLSPPTSFSMDDMRCFHHFLTVAYPHLPLGNDSVWVQDIPVFAQQHEYLMHALLALGASHLTRVSRQSDYSTTAIIHRGQAIKGLNEALAKGGTGNAYGESDALLAACYALTFQASYMGDGMADFITMVRGCALITEQIQRQRTRTAFNLEKDIHLRLMEPRLADLPTLNPTLLHPAIIAFEALRPLLRTPTDHSFHAALLAVLFALLHHSSKAGYLTYMHVYATFYDMSHDQFAVFVDPANIPAQLLMAHFIGLQMLMVPLMLHESPERTDAAKASTLLGMVEWGCGIFERMAVLGMEEYLGWARGILETVRRELEALDAGTYLEGVGLRILGP